MAIDKEAAPPRDPRQDPSFDPVGESRRLLRSVRTATLATLTGAGAPFATLTTIATDYDGTPILLLSKLAHHTGNLERDGRCSLLLAVLAASFVFETALCFFNNGFYVRYELLTRLS